MHIVKRNGNTVMYDDQKIIKSILNANSASADPVRLSENKAASIANEVFSTLAGSSSFITTAEIREEVVKVLGNMGLDDTARVYSEYKKQKDNR